MKMGWFVMSETLDELLGGLVLDLLPTPDIEKRVYEAVVRDRWVNRRKFSGRRLPGYRSPLAAPQDDGCRA